MTTVASPSSQSGTILKSLPLAMLYEGVVLGSSIFDRNNNLLLRDGATITKEFVIGLHKRGIRFVNISEKDWKRLTSFASKGKSKHSLPHRNATPSDEHCHATDELDGDLARMKDSNIVPSEDPFAQQVQHRGTDRYDQGEMDAVIDHYSQSANQVSELLGNLSQGANVASQAVTQLSKDSLERAARDLDLFVCMGINPAEGGTIYEHSINVASLAIGIGATLGLDQNDLSHLGSGCAVHDAGMLHLDPELYQTERVLNDAEFSRITKHPIISCDLLEHASDHIPLGVRMVVYQMHERCDGSGYPRGWGGNRIHPLAKISAVADAYVALVSRRPHRHAMLLPRHGPHAG